MQISQQTKEPTLPSLKPKKLGKKQSIESFWLRKDGSLWEEDVADAIDHTDWDKMFQMAFQQGKKGHIQPQKCQRKGRNSKPENSRPQKDHFSAIVHQMMDKLGQSQDWHHSLLQGMLKQKKSYAPIKFILLCASIFKFACFHYLNPLLNQRISLKRTKIEKRHAENQQVLTQSLHSMDFMQELKEKIAKQCHLGHPLARSFQDIIIEEVFPQVQTPKKSTQIGLKGIRKRKIKQADWLKSNLLKLQMLVHPQATDAQERQEHIRPNFGGIALEDIRQEYLEGEDHFFFSSGLQEQA